MSFGWSAGDLIASIHLLLTIGEAIKDARHADSEYQDTVAFLTSLASTLNKLRNPRLVSLLDAADIAPVKAAIEDFKESIEKRYGVHLAQGQPIADWKRKLLRAFKKLDWALFSSEQVKQLQSRIDLSLSAIEITLSLETLRVGNEALKVGSENKKIASDTLQLVTGMEAHGQCLQDDQRRDRILDWLRPIALADIHRVILTSMTNGTGNWLFATQAYQYWVSQTGPRPTQSILWVSGSPGAGKTRVAARTVESLQSQSEAAFFYCSTHEDARSNLLGILRTWAWQLLEKDPSLLNKVDQIRSTSAGLIISEVMNILHHLLERVQTPVFILDGLDECKFDSDEMSTIIASLNARLVIFSRHYRSIIDCLKPLSHMVTHLRVTEEHNRSDIDDYLAQEVPKLNLNDKKLEHQIIRNLRHRAGGMFLWAALMMQELAKPDKIFDDDYLQTLEMLPSDLNGLYSHQLSRLLKPPRTRPRIRLVFQWLSSAANPLSLREIGEILTISVDNPDLERTPAINRTRLRDFVRESCGVLVDISQDVDDTATVSLIHASLKDFLLGRVQDQDLSLTFDEGETHMLLARTCLTYMCYESMSFPDLASNVALRFDDNSIARLLNSRVLVHLQTHPFLEYACTRWSWHYKRAKISEDGKDSLRRLCESEIFTIRWLQVLLFWAHHRTCEEWFLAAASVMNDLLEILGSTDPDFEEYRIWTQHLLRAEHDRFTWSCFIRFLSADRGCSFVPALHVAALFDMEDFVTQEIKRGIDVDLCNWRGTTPLAMAARGGSVNTVKKLLEIGANPNMSNMEGSTPLILAIGCSKWDRTPGLVDMGHDHGLWSRSQSRSRRSEPFSVAEILLRAGANPFGDGLRSLSRLCCSASPEDTRSLRLASLMLKDAPPLREIFEDKSFDSMPPLHVAIRNGHMELVTLLLTHGADVNHIPVSRTLDFFENYERPPLLFALESSRPKKRMIEELLAKGAAVSARRKDGRTALHLCARRPADFAEPLLKNGIDIDCVAADGSTPLYDAVSQNHTELVTLLCRRGASLNAKNRAGYTPLDVAVENGNLRTAAELCRSGASTDTEMFSVLLSMDGEVQSAVRKQVPYWPRTVQHVFESFWLVQSIFYRSRFAQKERAVRDLAARILDEAQYWLRSTKRSDEPLAANEAECASIPPYIVSDPIYGRSEQPVRRVTFNIRGHDQGFSDYPEWHGTQQRSFTWYEVGIHRADGSHFVFTDKDERNLVANFHAVWTTSTYRIDCGYEAGQRACRWMSELEPGDCVAIRMRAQYLGWVNYIEAASIEIYTTCLRP